MTRSAITPRRHIAAQEFDGGRGYLAACTVGLPPRVARDAIHADLERWWQGSPDPVAYTSTVESTRAAFAALVGVPAARVSIGSQASVSAALFATAVPRGSEVLVPEGEFSSLTLPFVHADRDLRIRTVPRAALADEIRARTGAVVFSVVQSATGAVADVDAVVAAAGRVGALTLCDATQAVGWLPVDAATFDGVICHAYKWLCAPRGVSFLTMSPRLIAAATPLFAGWYAGADPWSSCYGTEVRWADGASRFDVSPAWQAFVGAAPAIRMFADLDPRGLHDHAVGLATMFRERVGLEPAGRPSAIVTWDDREGVDLARLTAAGITASGRAGRARAAFHVFTDDEDVENAAAALGR